MLYLSIQRTSMMPNSKWILDFDIEICFGVSKCLSTISKSQLANNFYFVIADCRFKAPNIIPPPIIIKITGQ